MGQKGPDSKRNNSNNNKGPPYGWARWGQAATRTTATTTRGTLWLGQVGPGSNKNNSNNNKGFPMVGPEGAR